MSLFGWMVIIGGFYASSRDRKCINFRPVVLGILLQYVLGLFVLRTQAGYDIFTFLGFLAKSLLGYAGDGTAFITSPAAVDSGWFLVVVLPPMIFFVSFIQLLYYWGWMQWLIRKFAAFFFHAMDISGAEAVVAAASSFLGQGESAVLVKPFLPVLTRAVLRQVMTSGFATIAGTVLTAYTAMGISPLVLISSCAMSIPASITISKLRYPESDEPATRARLVSQLGDDAREQPRNSLHALAIGSLLGLRIAGMVAASVLCVLAVLGLANGLLGWWGSCLNIEDLNIQLVLGYVFYPVAFLLGVEWNDDLLKVARLIEIKVVANEFIAYGYLAQDPYYATLTPRSKVIAMYALCGFGNISAVGIQVGALSQLAPGKAGQVAELAVSALTSGVFATLTSAAVAGMLVVAD